MFSRLYSSLTVAALSMFGGSTAMAGQQCMEIIELYTTLDFFLQEQGTAPVNGCMRQRFPASTSLVEGWTFDEGTFAQGDPEDPSSWNATSGLALAIEDCYNVPTWPFFPPGTCGIPMHPTYEGEYDFSGLQGREWVMRWNLTTCGTPPQGEFEYKVQVVRQEYCLDLLINGFE